MSPQPDSAYIAEIMAAVNAGRAGDAQLPVLIGERDLASHGTPPRVVWVPTRDTFGPPVPGVGAVTVQQVMTLYAEYDVHCWGASIDDARALMVEVVLAGFRCAGRYFAATGAQWVIEGEVEHLGAVAVLAVKLAMGVSDRPSTRAPVKVVTADVRVTDKSTDSFDITIGSLDE